ncbi:MAG TPA: hypothetical protein VIE40_01695 [Dehalococcoidia bacterium]|jgi:hypothetical protein
MKLTNEHQRVPVPLPDGRQMEGIVQVRGLDLRVRGRGVVVERRQPVAVIVRTPDTLRRLTIDESHSAVPLLIAALPLASLTMRRLMRRAKEAS